MTIEQALFQIHEGLPRYAPGSEATTNKVLRRLGRLPRKGRAIELGCGTGAATHVLAKRLRRALVAIDAHQPFLTELASSLDSAGLADSVELRHADFSTLGHSLGRFDLVWAEGAAYVLGSFEQALLAWHPLLTRGGRAAISEPTYLVEQPHEDVRAYWSSVYPGISTLVGNCAAAERAGFALIESIAFSGKENKAYYGPLKGRIAKLRAAGDLDAELCAVIAELEQEMLLAERYPDEVGYVFYLLESQGAGDDVNGASLFGDEGDEDLSALWAADGESANAGDYADLPDRSELSRAGSLPRRRQLATAVSSRAFDVSVAPSNPVMHEKLEQQIVDLIGAVGLSRASAVFEQIARSLSSVIVNGK